ncbi:MAG: DUF3147 family protein [Solirubrobacteraceae bacterium]
MGRSSCSSRCCPRRSSPSGFAGLFGAAPAVALAGLAVTLVAKGVADAHDAALGMLAGAAGVTVYAAVATVLLRRRAALRSALLAVPAWRPVAAVVLLPMR